jgi:hypothetical protein
MTFRPLAMLAFAAALTGCAATGPKFAQQETSMPKLSADNSRVYFYRADSFVGGGLRPQVMLDGAAVGKSAPGGYFYVDTSAGNHQASTSTETTNTLNFMVNKGETKYVRTKVSMGVLVGHVVPELVSADEAQKELSSLSYTGGGAN